MNEAAIDTLTIAQQLQDAGFDDKQARAVTFAIRDGLTGSLASKEDIADLRSDVKQDIAHLDGKIAALRGELKEDITQLRGEMIEIRGELKQDIAHLDGKIADLRGELKEDIARLEGKIETTATGLRGEIEAQGERLEGKISELRTELVYIRWIGAVIVVGVLIPLIRDFLL